MSSPISIITMAFNEEACILELYRRITEVCREHGLTYEIVLVDDGSTDATGRLISELAEKDPCVRPVLLQRRFGQTAALSAGIDHARYPVIATLDADLQNDPADIPQMLAKLEEGYDVVTGWRKLRQDALLVRRVPSIIANALIRNVTKVRLHDYGCTLKVCRASVLRRVNLYGELHRYVPALCAAVGARITEVPVRHHPRTLGKSKYGLGRTFRVVLDLLTVKFLLAYSTRPMHFFGMAGILCLLGAFLSGGATVVMKFTDPTLTMNRNPLLYLAVMLAIVAGQFLAVGLLAELVMRTYHESQKKPIYVLRESILGSDKEPGRADS